MIRWGMGGNSHDASLAVFENNRLYWAALSKDFSDVPNDPDPNWTMPVSYTHLRAHET